MRGSGKQRFVIDHGPAEESAVRSCGMFLVVMSLVCFLSLSYVVRMLCDVSFVSSDVQRRFRDSYAVIVSPFLPHFDVWILDAIKDDEYYCILLPMTIVPSVLVLYLNWLGMKFYRHN